MQAGLDEGSDRETAARAEAGLPPATRIASLTAPADVLEEDRKSVV